MDFAEISVSTSKGNIFVARAGSGPPLLLLHGFPETHLMWQHIAPGLSKYFTVVCADLPGYGSSGCPIPKEDHEPHSKRSMGDQMIEVMSKLGFNQFSVVGHDRGGRIAYRMAVDHPEVIDRVAVLDIVPTSVVWDNATKEVMISFMLWTLLAQPAPLSESILMKNATTIVEDALSTWGTSPEFFSKTAKEAYVRQLSNPGQAQSICEEYRAAATIDYEIDKRDEEAMKKISCPLLVLWDKQGSLDRWYSGLGGVPGVWKKWADEVSGKAIDGGHFFPESNPGETMKALIDFFSANE